MSKFSNMIKLLLILLRNGRIKTKDLAIELEVSERMVRKYINDLILANVHINSIPGPNGGYELLDFKYLSTLNFTENEVEALQLAVDFLKDYNFTQIAHIYEILKKIKATLNKGTINVSQESMLVKEAPSIYATKEREYALDIHLAIISTKKIKVVYTSLTSGKSERLIRPYGIINYKSSSYLIGYCENRKKILSFKISRFQSVETLNEKYVIPEEFSLKEFAGNSLGIYNDDIFNLKLKIDWPMSYIISEKKWVDNQKITWVSDKTIFFEADMAGKTEIISWILSMGECVSVLEPPFLRNEIKNILIKMINTI